jgi:transcriptional regulator of acetoin/glycerol metabolism
MALWEIAVPPLRARRVDVLEWLLRLRETWLRERPAMRQVAFELLPDAVETLLLHPWPDNLRGLDRLVHVLTSASLARPIGRLDLPTWLRNPPPPVHPNATPTVPNTRMRRETPAREEILRVHAALGGNVRAMARHFDRDRRQIYRWLEALGLKRGEDP